MIDSKLVGSDVRGSRVPGDTRQRGHSGSATGPLWRVAIRCRETRADEYTDLASII